jgi:CrcB protein
MIWLAVAFGGALGSMARHGVNLFFAHTLERAVPYATATVNLIGSAVIGLLAALIATGRLHWSTQLRTFVFVGILGGFTTFSTFGYETFQLLRAGQLAAACASAGMQLVLGLGAVWAGDTLVRSIWR